RGPRHLGLRAPGRHQGSRMAGPWRRFGIDRDQIVLTIRLKAVASIEGSEIFNNGALRRNSRTSCFILARSRSTSSSASKPMWRMVLATSQASLVGFGSVLAFAWAPLPMTRANRLFVVLGVLGVT